MVSSCVRVRGWEGRSREGNVLCDMMGEEVGGRVHKREQSGRLRGMRLRGSLVMAR